MKLRISLLIILISMLFASCGISTGKGTEQKEEEISVLRYDKLLSEYVRSKQLFCYAEVDDGLPYADENPD